MRNVCPDGWHVPDTADYGQLLRYLETWNYQNDSWPYIESLNPPSLGTFDMYMSPSGTSDVMVVNQSIWSNQSGQHIAHTANNATGLSIFESGSLFGGWDPLPKFWSSTAVPTGSPLPVFQLGVYPLGYSGGWQSVWFHPIETADGAAIRCIKD